MHSFLFLPSFLRQGKRPDHQSSGMDRKRDDVMRLCIQFDVLIKKSIISQRLQFSLSFLSLTFWFFAISIDSPRSKHDVCWDGSTNVERLCPKVFLPRVVHLPSFLFFDEDNYISNLPLFPLERDERGKERMNCKGERFSRHSSTLKRLSYLSYFTCRMRRNIKQDLRLLSRRRKEENLRCRSPRFWINDQLLHHHLASRRFLFLETVCFLF